MVRVDPVLIVRERGEAVDVLPDRLVRRVEEVCTVAVHLDASFWVGLTVGVAADVMAAVDDRDFTARGCGPFGDREAEKARSDDEKIHAVLSLGESVVARDEAAEDVDASGFESTFALHCPVITVTRVRSLPNA